MFQVEDNLLLDQKDCPICFGKSKQIDILGTINKGSDEMVMLRECDVCTHWWINPLPKQELLSHWYGIGSGFVISPLNYSGTSPDDVHSEKIFLRLTNLYKSPDFNYLEIGCGTGNLLKFFSKTAKIAYGVEPGSWGAKDGLNIISDISLLPDNVKFDIVVLGDVLEHVSDPNDMIKKVSEVANKNAIIYMNFPNRSQISRLLKTEKLDVDLSKYKDKIYVDELTQRDFKPSVVDYVTTYGNWEIENFIEKDSATQENIYCVKLIEKRYGASIIFHFYKYSECIQFCNNINSSTPLEQKEPGFDLTNIVKDKALYSKVGVSSLAVYGAYRLIKNLFGKK